MFIMPNKPIDQEGVVETLNGILELELAGVVRYMHYSFMVFGHNRIPVVKWMRAQAEEGMLHAAEAGEFITTLGGHPSLKIGKLLETEKHSITQILEESVEHEEVGLQLYHALLEQTEGRDVALEEYARTMIAEETKHVAEIRKMLRKPLD
jgi:bacterioferritin